jgi:hypothetical protein
VEAKQRDLRMELGLVVNPIFTLPSEIISRVFVQCLPSHGCVRPSPVTAPLLLGQICRDWRDIALSSCELPNSIEVAFIAQRWTRHKEPNDGHSFY